MAKSNSGHLRLHVERSESVPAQNEDLTALNQVLNALNQMTDADLQLDLPGEQASDASVAVQIPHHPSAMLRWNAGDSTAQLTTVVRAVGQMFDELQETRRALWQREAELATAVPLSYLEEDEYHLADRLECILHGGANALHCHAGALYLLDDATSQLKLRASCGLPKRRLTDAPRPLRGALVDLEALIGHAVVLDADDLAMNWEVPESFASAICVPVATSMTPLGTLWFFSVVPRDFSAEDCEMAELVAGRLVADLECAILRRENQRNRQSANQMHDAFQWQQERLPSIEPPVDTWTVGGWRDPNGWVGRGFYDWTMIPDGRIAVALGEVDGEQLVGGMGAASLRAALHSHLNYVRDAATVLEQVNETLWTISPGGQFASLLVGLIDPHTHQFEFSTSGKIQVFKKSAKTLKPLTTDRVMIGEHLDHHFANQKIKLRKGESIVALNQGAESLVEPMSQLPVRGTSEIFAANRMVDLIRDEWAQSGESSGGDDCVILAATRVD